LPAHTHHVATGLTCLQQQLVGKALTRSELVVLFELPTLLRGPRVMTLSFQIDQPNTDERIDLNELHIEAMIEEASECLSPV
jgi:hypothetical protein